MKYFEFSKLNRHAMSVLAYMNDTCKGMKEGEEKEISLACECEEHVCEDGNSVFVHGSDFTVAEIVTLNGTYSKWRKDNGLQPALFDLHLNMSSTIGEVSETMYYTMNVSICKSDTLGASLFDEMEEEKDVPKTLKKRDGKAEKAKTAENNAKKEEEAKTVEEAKKIVEEAKTAEATAEEEIKNEDKALKASADKFNAEVEKDNAEILQNCIKSYTEMICKLFGDDVDKEQKKAVAKMLSNFAVAISE